MLEIDFDDLCFGRRIQISGRSGVGIFNNDGASSILTWVQADTASAACPAHPGSPAMTSITFAAVICHADEPCSVNTAEEPESFFYNVTSEYNSAFVFLQFWFQLRILEMTVVH